MLRNTSVRALGALGLLAAALPATAVATAFAPTAAADSTCSATVAVTNDEDGTSLGSLAQSQYGIYAPTTGTAQTMDLDALLEGALGEVVTQPGQTNAMFGATSTNDNQSWHPQQPDELLSTGASYMWFSDSSSVAEGPAVDGTNAAESAQQQSFNQETVIWSLDDSGDLGATWVNAGGAKPAAQFGYISIGFTSWVFITANFNDLQAAITNYDLVPVTLTAVPTEGSDCTVVPPDTTAPTASITAGPVDGDTVTTAPTYEFTSDEEGYTFECAVDDDAFADCTSPYTVDITELDDGDHTFSVRATDLADNTSDVVTRDFTLDAVDTEAPVTTIDSGPVDGASVETAPTFGFSSTADDVDRFECSLDGVTFTTCTSPFDTDVQPGTFTFSVRAVDESNNVGDAVSRSFTLRDIACEDATAAFQAAKADVRTAKDRLAAARESGNPKRIERSKERLADAKDVKNDAKADVAEECGPSLSVTQ